MFFRLRPAGSQPTTTDPDILGKNPKNPEIVSTAKPQNELAKNPQTIQEQLLRPTKINPAKAVISFTQSDIIEEENKSLIGPGDQRGLSHLKPGR
jgi:hypothetical protein